MVFPERFANLPEHAWPRLRALLDVHPPGGDPLNLTIGQPGHEFPAFVRDIIADSYLDFGSYPANDGTAELLAAISGWVQRRYGVTLSENRLMALNGTREGLFNAAMALCPEAKNGRTPKVLVPNPFYQVYAVAAVAAGAMPVYLPTTRETGHLPDLDALDADTLDRTAIVYLCSPSNPQGAIASHDYWRQLLELAERHDFRVFADECYSEVWRGEPPVGALQVAEDIGADPERVLAFHSLSKRSNLPGLRSGFVAGGPKCIAEIRQLRAYAGAPLPLPIQRASAKVWEDEGHVETSRQRYVEKFRMADEAFQGIEGYESPTGGFFLWMNVGNGETASLKLWRETGVRVLPGAYLAREVNGENPGKDYIRVALVAEEQELAVGLGRIRDCLFE